MGTNALQDHPDQNKGENLKEAVKLDQIANVLRIYDQQVDVTDEPDFTPTFGTLFQETYNERNRRRSRRKTTYVDTNDLFTKQSGTRHGAMGDGGGRTTTSIDLEDATGGLPAPTANSLLLVSSEVEHMGRAHATRVDTVVDAWNEVTRKTTDEHPDAGGNQVDELDQIVAPATAIPTGPTIITAWKEYVDDAKSRLIQKVAPNGFRTLVTTDLLDRDAFGDEADEEVLIVDLPYTMPAATWLTAQSTLEDLGTGKGRYVRKDVDAWPTFIDEDEEHTTGKEVLITRTIVDTSTFTQTKGVARQYHTLKHLDAVKGLHVKREIDATVLTDTWTEYHNVQYYFPTYLQPGTPFALINAGDSFIIAPNQSSDLSVKIPCRFEITYHTTAQIPNNIFQFKPVDLRLISPSFRLDLRDVLTDSGLLYFRFDDGSGGYTEVEWQLPASDPTATDYVNTLMGTEVQIADDSSRWKYNLYRRVKVYMTLPDLDLGMNTQIGYY